MVFLGLLEAHRNDWELTFWFLDLVLDSARVRVDLDRWSNRLLGSILLAVGATRSPALIEKLEYWACSDLSLEDAFEVSPIVREAHLLVPTRLQGVWRRKEGGVLIRGRALDPRTGKLREVKRLLDDADESDAFMFLKRELDKIRAGAEDKATTRMRFADYAVSLVERKILTGDIKSAKTKEMWGYTLEHHLIPVFKSFYVDALRRADVEQWKASVGRMIRAGEYSPNTANGWLAVLRVIITAAVAEFELERNPMLGVTPFDASTHHTYTEEEPNALTVDELPTFLDAFYSKYPQYFAFAFTGFVTGLRPSSIRPLRRAGPTPDVRWDDGVILVRRSQTRGDEVMDTTKTAKHQRITVPDDLMRVLRWHVDRLPDGRRRTSELLFPSVLGSFLGPTTLLDPFADTATSIGLKKHIPPRAMRRTFQDLARAAQVNDLVTRAVSGHATEAMQYHYSSVSQSEVKEGLAKVISLVGFRRDLRTSNEAPSGASTPETTKAGSGSTP